VVRSKKNGNFYTGVTGDLEQRLKQHNEGLVLSTKHMRPLQLVYFEACIDKNDAYHREKFLKTGMGKRYIRNRLKRGLTG
jgi:putative endonuclease